MGKIKLEGFPSIWYTSLEESIERREFMSSQFDRYGLTGRPYIVPRFNLIADNYTIIQNPKEYYACNGASVTHLNMMREWYLNTNDEWVVFCEDDHSFESVEYWNFTWKDIFNRLPPGADCVQLIRIDDKIEERTEWKQFKILFGRWWGSASLMHRKYVKKVLDFHFSSWNTIHLDWHNGHCPITENILFVNKGLVYNLPLLLDNVEFRSQVTDLRTLPDEEYSKTSGAIYLKKSREEILNFWMTLGPTLSVDDFMRL